MMRRLVVVLTVAAGLLTAPAYAAQQPSPVPDDGQAGSAPVWAIVVLLVAIAVISVRALLRKDATWWVDER